MCSVSASHFLSLAPHFKAAGPGIVACACRSLSPRLSEHSSAHSKGTNLGTCCLQQLLTHYCHSQTSAAEGRRLRLRAFPRQVPTAPRAGPQQHLPASSCCVWAELASALQGRARSRWERGAFPRAPVQACNWCAAPGCSSQLWASGKNCAKNSSSFLGSEHRNGIQLWAITYLTRTERNHWWPENTMWVWAHEKGKLQNTGLKQGIKFNYIFIELCIFHCIMIYIGYSIM